MTVPPAQASSYNNQVPNDLFPPSAPNIVQTQNEVTSIEVDLLASNASFVGYAPADITKVLDKRSSTSVASLGAGTFSIFLQQALSIGRVSVLGSFGGGFTITITKIDGTVTVFGPFGASAFGVDTGLFAPVEVTKITITNAAGASTIKEVVARKGIVINGSISTNVTIDNTPGTPIFTQDQGVIGNEEVSLTATGGPVGALTNALDRDASTTVVWAGAGSLTATFAAPLLIDRVGVQGSVTGLTAVVTSIDGTTFTVIPLTTDADGADSGQFTPILATKVVFSFTGATTIKEAPILKVKETEDGHTQKSPLQVEAEQQVVLDEVTIVDGPDGAFAGQDMSKVMDKDLSTTIVSTGEGEFDVNFKAPKLISRIAVAGDWPTPPTITVTDELLNTTTITGTATEFGIDTGNFDPIMARKIDFHFPDAPATVAEVTILKVIETKAAANLNPVANASYFSSVTLVGGDTKYANGAAFTTPDAIGAVAARFIDVGKDKQDTITAQVKAVAGAAVTTFSTFLDWYFSFNAATWTYGGSSVFKDTAAAGNPTGFVAAAGTSEQALAKPANIYGKFIAIVVRHVSPAGTNSITVTINLNRQR